jgi:Lon protease-like protein
MAADFGFRSIADLPETIPVFPLDGALVLPRAQLPLNIFEPRYLAMTEAALATKSRLIGMIQTAHGDMDEASPELAEIGCAGKIVNFNETGDGRYMIALAGVCRFRLEQELATDAPYRVVRADWKPFAADLVKPLDASFDRKGFEAVLKQFFSTRDLAADWESIHTAPMEPLVNQLAMGCPFEPAEKQALLEAGTVQDRLDVLTALMRMAAAGGGDPGAMQ